MKTAIIAAKTDPAGMNISSFLEKENLEDLNSELHYVEKESIFNEDIDKKIDSDIFIFATKHQSSQGVHSLSCHAPGNWAEAEAGGKDRRLCVAPALLLREAFLGLNRLGAGMHHEITLEVTHHGPYLEKPCMFIEIGSDEKNWKNPEAGRIVAEVIINLLENMERIMKNEGKIKTAFGIGGPHYANTFTRRVLEGKIAVGHICPKYMIGKIDREMILQGIERTVPRADYALLDWKGLGSEKKKIIEILEESGVEHRRTDKL